MPTFVLSPNCHRSFPSIFIPSQFQNPNFNSLNFKSNQLHTSISHTRFKTPRYSSSIVQALDKDSNPETLQDGKVDNLGVKVALSMLKFYKREISPILPKSCRYIPTCSEYSMEAYKRYGVMKGTILTAWRLCRCNPLGGSGYDPPRWFDEPIPRDEFDD